jgi:hypothetical protein
MLGGRRTELLCPYIAILISVLDLTKQHKNQTGATEMRLLRAVADYKRTEHVRNKATS